MDKRPAVLQEFLDQLHDVLMSDRLDSDMRRCRDRVFTALADYQGSGQNMPARLPTCSYLPWALATASGAYGSLAASFATLEPNLTWTKRPSADHTASANFANCHANAMIVGPNGHEPRDDVWVGVSLLAPHVRYPDHDHRPEEIYLVLSKGQFQHGEDDWFEPGVGGKFYNTPNIRHAMASGDEPLFAVWCLAPAN